MSVLDIILFPDKRLRKKCVKVKKIDKKIIRLLDDMDETMYDAPGVGLAAPQVGENIRVIVVDISSKEEDSKLIELINPVIVESKGSQLGEEGCLSVPGFAGNVKRGLNVKVEGLDRDGESITLDASDLFSRVLQHEIDHLDGILFFDRMTKLKRELFKKKVEKVLGKE